MARIRFALGIAFVCFLSSVSLISQENCPALSVPQVIPGTNIFNAQQEVWLGEAQAGPINQTVAFIGDKELTNYLQKVVDRLATSLPTDHIPFRVKLMDAPTAEAFSIAGGRIYISRKIVAMMRSEDELAGVLAHEMGHIVAHHAAIQASQEFRKILGVTKVTDRDDVFARWNELLSNYRRQKPGSFDKAFEIEEREQVQADTVALYLVSRAGYSPQAFETFFDRLAETKGNAGGFWSNLFGTTRPDSKRLGQIVRNTPVMPKTCMAPNVEVAADFERWKKSVVESSVADLGRDESVPGLVSKRVLTERLRPEVQYIRISPDGKYVLAQDDSNAFVLERQPLKSVFHFDALEAEAAQFTPDSRGVVLLFAGMGASPRVERWDIASQKRLEVHEVYVRDGCLLSKLSPDGRSLACLTRGDIDSAGFLKFDLDLYDVVSGTSFLHKKGWMTFDLARMFWFADSELMKLLFGTSQRLLEDLSPMAFSPDGHYFVAHSRQNTLAMDLTSRNPIDLPGSVRNLLDYSFVFLTSDRLMGVAGGNGEKSEVVEFPSGRVIYKDLNIGGSHLDPVAHGDHVLLRPVKDHPVGIFDLKQNKIVVASKRSAIDLWDERYIAERLDGDLQVFELGTIKPVEHAQLPEAPLGTIRADAISPDLNWLAVSQKTRGAIWDLQTGRRIYHLRGFSAASFTPDGAMYADFPKYLTTDRTLARMALSQQDIRAAQTIDEKQHTVEAGRFLLTIIPAKDNTYTDVSMQLRDIVDENVVWTKHFPHERPGYHVDARANSLVLYWQASSASAKAIAKDDPAASAAISRFKDKDGTLFVQAFDLDTGKLRAQIAIDTGKHSFQVAEGIATSDRVVIADNQNRVLVYSFDGQAKGTIVGHSPEVSAKADLLTVHTERGELELYDLTIGQKRATYDFNSRVAFNGFSGDGKRLLVLTSDQVVYVLDPATQNSANALAAK